MTSNIRILLAQIGTFEAQHKAGLNPPCTALAEFFETARLARLDVEAFDRELAPPDARRVVTPREPLALERLDDRSVEVFARIPLPVVARAVLNELEAHGTGVKPLVIGGGPCGS